MLPRSTEIQPYVAPIRPSPRFTLFSTSRLDSITTGTTQESEKTTKSHVPGFVPLQSPFPERQVIMHCRVTHTTTHQRLGENRYAGLEPSPGHPPLARGSPSGDMVTERLESQDQMSEWAMGVALCWKRLSKVTSSASSVRERSRNVGIEKFL